MQKHVNLVDLVKSFPTNIYLQKSASIQPRTSHLIFIILAASRDLIFTERSCPQVGEKGLAKLLRSSELSEEEAQKLIAQFGESGAVNLEQLKAVFGHMQGQKRSQSRAREP